MVEKYYKILDLDSSATIIDIKNAYRKMVKLYHPDVSNFKNSHEKFITINEAYRYLLNYKLGKTTILGHSNTISYEDWVKYRRKKARKEAARHAKIRYEEFKKSKIYKSAQIVYMVFNYFYILIGLIMIVIPIATLMFNEIDDKKKPTVITATLTLSILGCLFIFMILSTRKNNKF